MDNKSQKLFKQFRDANAKLGKEIRNASLDEATFYYRIDEIEKYLDEFKRRRVLDQATYRNYKDSLRFDIKEKLYDLRLNLIRDDLNIFNRGWKTKVNTVHERQKLFYKKDVTAFIDALDEARNKGRVTESEYVEIGILLKKHFRNNISIIQAFGKPTIWTNIKDRITKMPPFSFFMPYVAKPKQPKNLEVPDKIWLRFFLASNKDLMSQMYKHIQSLPRRYAIESIYYEARRYATLNGDPSKLSYPSEQLVNWYIHQIVSKKGSVMELKQYPRYKDFDSAKKAIFSERVGEFSSLVDQAFVYSFNEQENRLTKVIWHYCIDQIFDKYQDTLAKHPEFKKLHKIYKGHFVNLLDANQDLERLLKVFSRIEPATSDEKVGEIRFSDFEINLQEYFIINDIYEDIVLKKKFPKKNIMEIFYKKLQVAGRPKAFLNEFVINLREVKELLPLITDLVVQEDTVLNKDERLEKQKEELTDRQKEIVKEIFERYMSVKNFSITTSTLHGYNRKRAAKKRARVEAEVATKILAKRLENKRVKTKGKPKLRIIRPEQ